MYYRPFRASITQTYSGQTTASSTSTSSMMKATGSHTSLDRSNAGMISTASPVSTASIHRDEALLAIYVSPPEAGGVGHYKPFLLPPRNPGEGSQSVLEKGLGYGAFGVVW